MTSTVFIAVIAAALLHAIWNALLKSGQDKHLGMSCVVLGQALIGVLLLPFIPIPDAQSWPYLLAAIVLHTGYQIVLTLSYRLGDLTQVYPIARGTSPLLVAGVSIFILGETLTSYELLGILMIGVGIISLSLVRQKDGQRNVKAGLSAFVTGCFIAAYSLVDGYGARAADTAIGFYAWLTIGNAIVFVIYMRMTKPGILRQIPKSGLTMLLVGGGASFVGFTIVLWAFIQAPIVLVTALRETSIVFALLIGVVFLRERLSLMKVFSTFITLFGAAVIRFSK